MQCLVVRQSHKLSFCVQNKATCESIQGTFTCYCEVGYEGKSCEVRHVLLWIYDAIDAFMTAIAQIDIDECTSNPCRNGQLCVDGNAFALVDFASFITRWCRISFLSRTFAAALSYKRIHVPRYYQGDSTSSR
jgi:hypothetical protein